MRLLHTKNFRLETFFGASTPPYAILSHTWEKEEVLFGDIKDPNSPLPTHKVGWQKIVDACGRAVEDDFEWIWIDTCCIDKESSAELSEAINSMFKWYRQAHICYAYLSDVRKPGGPSITFDQSRWFTRGWTLQELIAPRDVRFYDFAWNQLGARQGYTGGSFLAFVETVSQRTGIPLSVLTRNEFGNCGDLRMSGPLGFITHRSHRFDDGRCRHCYHEDELPSLLEHFSISQRMSWAASRETTRKEDRAYCLFGVFGVNMPLLYGEGEQAFIRLQEEIIKVTEDQSILAFESPDRYAIRPNRPLLAASPQYFEHSSITALPHGKPSRMNITAKSIELTLVLFPCRYQPRPAGYLPQPADRVHGRGSSRKLYLAVLDCAYESDLASRPGIVVEEVDQPSKTFTRLNEHLMIPIGPQTVARDLFRKEGFCNELWDLGKSPYECDLKDGRTEVVRLLLKQSEAHSIIPLRRPDPALNIHLFANLNCRYSYPTGLDPTATYIPSVFAATYKPGLASTATRSCGLICLQVPEGKHFFIEWGVHPVAIGTRTYEYIGWCKILDWAEVITDTWETGKLEKSEFEKAAKAYLLVEKENTGTPEWAAKEWPVHATDANGYELRTHSLRKCVVGMEFLGQKHLKMQVQFA